RLMENCEQQELSTQRFYRLMQEWIGERTLVDKTPTYCIDLDILRRAEQMFSEALYIHLVRHPLGMVHSFEEARTDRLFDYDHSFSPRELGELVWLVGHQNILAFLEDVPRRRQLRIRFEDLVKQPGAVVRGVCAFLGLDFHPEMLQPYQEKRRRMTDGTHA